jgi:predicted dehydrogenase
MAKTVRLGFIGAGGIVAGHHLPQLQKVAGVKIAALTDLNKDRAKQVAKQFGGKVYADHHELLEKAEIDALYVALPPDAHTDAEIIAADKGLHLFVQKPIVMDMEKGLEIWEAIKRNDVISSVGYQLRYSPSAQGVKAFLKDKQVALVASSRWGGIAGGPSHWWRVWKHSGGMFHEQATHGMDFIRYVVGDVARVSARYSLTVLRDVENLDIPDSQVIMLEFKSGAVGYYAASCALTKGGGGSTTEFILRDMMVRHTWGGVQVIPEEAGKIELPEQKMNEDEAFVEAVRTGDRSLILSDYFDALKTSEVTLGANASAQTGKPVSMKLAEWR